MASMMKTGMVAHLVTPRPRLLSVHGQLVIAQLMPRIRTRVKHHVGIPLTSILDINPIIRERLRQLLLLRINILALLHLHHHRHHSHQLRLLRRLHLLDICRLVLHQHLTRLLNCQQRRPHPHRHIPSTRLVLRHQHPYTPHNPHYRTRVNHPMRRNMSPTHHLIPHVLTVFPQSSTRCLSIHQRHRLHPYHHALIRLPSPSCYLRLVRLQALHLTWLLKEGHRTTQSKPPSPSEPTKIHLVTTTPTLIRASVQRTSTLELVISLSLPYRVDATRSLSLTFRTGNGRKWSTGEPMVECPAKRSSLFEPFPWHLTDSGVGIFRFFLSIL